MNIKIAIDEDNHVISYAKVGEVENSTEAYIDDDNFIHFEQNFKCYKYEDYNLIFDNEKLLNITLESEKEKARSHRHQAFQSLDLYDKAVLRGDIEESEDQKLQRDIFRTEWLQVPNNYTSLSTPIEESYPIMPRTLKQFTNMEV